jgi:hypothetical protein
MEDPLKNNQFYVGRTKSMMVRAQQHLTTSEKDFRGVWENFTTTFRSTEDKISFSFRCILRRNLWKMRRPPSSNIFFHL